MDDRVVVERVRTLIAVADEMTRVPARVTGSVADMATIWRGLLEEAVQDGPSSTLDRKATA